MHDDTVLTGCFGEAGLSGPAVMISPDGSEYRGGFVNCSLNGKGHLQSDHAFYRGEFCDGKFEGSGKQCWLGGQCTKDDLKSLAFYQHCSNLGIQGGNSNLVNLKMMERK